MKINEDVLLVIQMITIPLAWYLCFVLISGPYNWIAYCIISVAIFYFSNKIKKK